MMKKAMMASLRPTIAEFSHALSRMPRTSTHVMKATIRNAGRSRMTGMPATRGAVANTSADCRTRRLSPVTSPPAAVAAATWRAAWAADR